jgi:hypothetical protein
MVLSTVISCFYMFVIKTNTFLYVMREPNKMEGSTFSIALFWALSEKSPLDNIMTLTFRFYFLFHFARIFWSLEKLCVSSTDLTAINLPPTPKEDFTIVRKFTWNMRYKLFTKLSPSYLISLYALEARGPSIFSGITDGLLIEGCRH